MQQLCLCVTVSSSGDSNAYHPCHAVLCRGMPCRAVPMRCATCCLLACLLQDTVQTVQALKGASAQMRSAMKTSKELDLNFIDNLQVCVRACACVWVGGLVFVFVRTLVMLAETLSLC